MSFDFSLHQPYFLFSQAAELMWHALLQQTSVTATLFSLHPEPPQTWISKQTSSWWRRSRRLEVVPPRAKLLSGPGSPPAQEVQVLGCCWLSGLFLRLKIKLSCTFWQKLALRTTFQNPLNAQFLILSSDMVEQATSIPSITVVTT